MAIHVHQAPMRHPTRSDVKIFQSIGKNIS